MNSWRTRFGVAVCIIAASLIHDRATADLPNEPASMLLYHGSAAMADWLLLLVAELALRGRVCSISKWLLLASMFANFMGWIMYMSYAPPGVCNVLISTLTAAQLLTLFIPDRHDATHSWNDLVRDRARVSGSNNH